MDVFVTPAYGKKNRPVQVSARHHRAGGDEHLLAILMEESGTLGVRVLDQPRLVAERNREVRRVTVGGRAFEVRVKTSTVDGRVIAVKPEHEDLRRIALELPTNPSDRSTRRSGPRLRVSGGLHETRRRPAAALMLTGLVRSGRTRPMHMGSIGVGLRTTSSKRMPATPIQCLLRPMTKKTTFNTLSNHGVK